MNNDLEKQRQEFIIKFGFEPTPQELDNYINNKLNSQVFENIETTTYTPSNGSTSGWLVLLWFACSFGAILYLSGLEKTVELMLVFGHYFLVFGIMVFLSNRNIKNFSWLFLTGIVFMLTLVLFPGIIKVNLSHEMFMFLIFGLIFFIVGIIFIGKFISDFKVKKSFIEINAEVVGYDGDDMKACIFEYNFNEQIYKVTDNVYTSGRLPRIGTIKKIRVNPDKPDEIVFQTMSGYSLILAIPFTLIGGVFIIVALIA